MKETKRNKPSETTQTDAVNPDYENILGRVKETYREVIKTIESFIQSEHPTDEAIRRLINEMAENREYVHYTTPHDKPWDIESMVKPIRLDTMDKTPIPVMVYRMNGKSKHCVVINYNGSGVWISSGKDNGADLFKLLPHTLFNEINFNQGEIPVPNTQDQQATEAQAGKNMYPLACIKQTYCEVVEAICNYLGTSKPDFDTAIVGIDKLLENHPASQKYIWMDCRKEDFKKST